MSMTNRKYLYNKTSVNGNEELDYLQTNLHRMELKATKKIRITQALQHRLDLISLRYYGTYDLGWLIAEHNDIVDPFAELVVGAVIEIPYVDDYYRYYNRNARRV